MVDEGDARRASVWAGASRTVLPFWAASRARLGAWPSLTLLSLPCPQVFSWAPWTWCWTPVPAWPLTESCTRPRTRRSTGQWHVVGAGRGLPWTSGGGPQEGGDTACIPGLDVVSGEPDAAFPSAHTAQAGISLRKAAQMFTGALDAVGIICGQSWTCAMKILSRPTLRFPAKEGRGVLLPPSGGCQTVNEGPFCGLQAHTLGIFVGLVGDFAGASGPKWGAEGQAVFLSTDAAMCLVGRVRVFEELRSGLSSGRCWP